MKSDNSLVWSRHCVVCFVCAISLVIECEGKQTTNHTLSLRSSSFDNKPLSNVHQFEKDIPWKPKSYNINHGPQSEEHHNLHSFPKLYYSLSNTKDDDPKERLLADIETVKSFHGGQLESSISNSVDTRQLNLFRKAANEISYTLHDGQLYDVTSHPTSFNSDQYYDSLLSEMKENLLKGPGSQRFLSNKVPFQTNKYQSGSSGYDNVPMALNLPSKQLAKLQTLDTKRQTTNLASIKASDKEGHNDNKVNYNEPKESQLFFNDNEVLKTQDGKGTNYDKDFSNLEGTGSKINPKLSVKSDLRNPQNYDFYYGLYKLPSYDGNSYLIESNGNSFVGQSMDKRGENNKKIIPDLAKALAKELVKQQLIYDVKSSSNPSLKIVTAPSTTSPRGVTVEPDNPCDHVTYCKHTITCWFDRQVGDSVTLSLKPKCTNDNTVDDNNQFIIIWQRLYKVRKKTEHVAVNITADKAPWNIEVDSGGQELRISPLTNTDIDFNSFRGSLYCITTGNSTTTHRNIGNITFRFNILAIDIGFVYPGEELMINIENHITLPPEGIIIDWRLERNRSRLEDLPSNMKISESGRSLSIRELRSHEHGVIVCSMFSSRNVFIAKRRFLLRQPVKRNFKASPATGKHNITNILHTETSTQAKNVTEISKNRNSSPLCGGSPHRQIFRDRNKQTRLFTNRERKRRVDYKERSPSNDGAEVKPLLQVYHTSSICNEGSIISKCFKDRECSEYATCIARSGAGGGYCRCIEGYLGNGLFCQEYMEDKF
ncbi:uncharacterized protein LOC143236552 [Tachypleus tridentatus]|uniref:uncharacterized protein LOC143236552 n=1 Tax=Tachypleus tridentatus TaxID=6853 RepID=UPI003FCEEC42